MWRKGLGVWICVLLLGQTTGAAAKEQPVPSIQALINQAAEGDEITVAPGVYHERLLINKRIRLIGKGAIIDGGGKGNVIEIAADGVRIEGFTVRNSGRNLRDAGIHVTGDGCEVLRNQLMQVKLGIFLESARKATVMGNRLEGNSQVMSKRGNGIHLLKTSDSLISQNTFNQVQDGMYLDQSTGNEVSQNTVRNSRYAIHLMNATHNRLLDNRLVNNVNGFMIMDASDNLLEGNEISDHLAYRGYGILAYHSDRLQIRKNRILNNHTGIMLEKTRQLSLSENVLAGNSVGLELNQKNRDNEFFHNDFIGNVVQAKLPDKEQETLLSGAEKGNYWDDYQGLDLNDDRIGDVPYEAGTAFDRMVAAKPMLQLFFESPAVRMLSATEKIIPSAQSGKLKDQFPQLAPVALAKSHTNRGLISQSDSNWKFAATGVLLLGLSLLLLRLGRRVSS